jgi:hypothetical protein
MSRRRTTEAQRLAEDVAARLADRGSGFDRRLTPKQARDLKLENARLLEERRANSMRVLLRKQTAPWIVAAAVFVVGAICWLIRWRMDPLTAVLLAVLADLVIAWVAFMVGRRTKKWRTRVHLAAGVASLWLLYAAGTGPSWDAPLVWIVGTIVSSSAWWKANRPPHPKAPSREAVPVPVDQSIPVLWAEHLGGPGAILAGSALSDKDTTKVNCESYTVNLRPGKQSITGTLSYLELIAGGLATPVKQIVLEPHPDQNPNHVKLTVVQHSPIEKTIDYAGARIVGDHQHMIELGPYGDGDGYARWRMWQPGEQPMTGSWLSGLIIAGTGIGKSRLMELLAAGYMKSGNAIVWFNDPQGGASSPALQEYADWYTSTERTEHMIGALERIATAREKQNSVRGWKRFDPSPERPGIIALLDEGHVTIARYGNRLEALARKTQKVGVGFGVLTQGASLESLGKDILRASLMANLVVMKTGSSQTKNLLPGLPVDPEMLPKIAGFGYSVGTDGSRTAPFRAEHVAEPEHWFAQYKMPKLDALSAKAAGDVYQFRREAVAEEQEKDREYVEQMESGTYQPEPPEPDLDDWTPEPAVPRAFEVVRFPTAVAAPEKPARERVLVAVAQGTTRTREIGDAVGLGPSQLHAVLKDLLEKGELERPTPGVYQLAGVVSNPER